MFLQKVYKNSKFLFVLMLLFIIGQLFIDYKHGMVVTPFYHYGMYSEVIDPQSAYQVWEMEANGKLLRGQDFSPQQWDRIILPLQYYAGISGNNNFYETEVKRLLNKIHLSADSDKFLQTCNYTEFEEWYKKYLGNLTNESVATLVVQRRIYAYHSNKLIATNTVIALADLCR